MSAGWSRVRLFGHYGNFLAELNVPTKRSWVLNDVGRCTFTVPIYDGLSQAVNPACSLKNLQFGNLVFIEHTPSKNDDGTFNGILPAWAGIILPPRMWEYGKVTVTAYSAEQVLRYRALPIDYFLTGTAGSQFAMLLNFANIYNGPVLPITPGNIYTGGPHGEWLIKMTALEEIKNIIKTSAQDWDVTGSLDTSQNLSLKGNWYQAKGVVVNRVLSNLNSKLSGGMYVEQGDIYTSVRAYSDQTAGGNRNFNFVSDPVRLALYGGLVALLVLPGTANSGDSVIGSLATQWMAKNGQQVKTVAVSVLDNGQDFSYLNVGNTWQIQTDVVGFDSSGAIGINAPARILAMEYDDLTNEVRLAAAVQQ